MSFFNKFYWLIPFICGILCFIGILIPAGAISYYDGLNYYRLYFWIFGIGSIQYNFGPPKSGYIPLNSSLYSNSVLILIGSIISSIILLIMGIYLILLGLKAKKGEYTGKKIIVTSVIILISSIAYNILMLISLNLFIYTSDFSVVLGPRPDFTGFGLIIPYIASGIAVIGVIINKYDLIEKIILRSKTGSKKEKPEKELIEEEIIREEIFKEEILEVKEPKEKKVKEPKEKKVREPKEKKVKESKEKKVKELKKIKYKEISPEKLEKQKELKDLYIQAQKKIRDKIFTENTIDFLENIVREANKINFIEVQNDALRSLAYCREMRKEEKIKDLAKLFKYARLKIENKHYGQDTIDLLNEIIHESENYNIKENYKKAKEWLEYCIKMNPPEDKEE